MRIQLGHGLGLLAAALILSGPWSLPASAQPVGSEFRVNTYTTNAQASPDVAADDAGNFLVVWQSDNQDSADLRVFGQRFDSAGNPLADEFQVVSYTTGSHGGPKVAADGAGNFLVTWSSSFSEFGQGDMFARLFDAEGLPAGGEFKVGTYTEYQLHPAVAADGSGNFVVAWTGGQDGSPFSVAGQRLDSGGFPLGDEFQVNSYTTDYQWKPAVAVDDSGDFVVVWESRGQDGFYDGVFGRQFDSAGEPVADDFSINSYTTGNQSGAAVAATNSGAFVVVWQGPGAGDSAGVFGQRFDSSGAPLGSEFRANSYTTGSQGGADVAVDGSGSFLVVWRGAGVGDPDGGVFGQRFDSAGVPVGGELRINTYTTSVQGSARVAADGLDRFVVVWSSAGQDGSSSGVFGQRLAALLFGGTAASFEDGTVCGWDAAVGSGDVCPP